MYRLSLAAYWAAQPGELRPDECIEDIFAGGDGWADTEAPAAPPARRPHRPAARATFTGSAATTATATASSRPNDRDARSRSRSRDSHHHQRRRPPHVGFPSSAARLGGGGGDGGDRDRDAKRLFAGMSGRTSLEQHAHTLQAEAERTRSGVAASSKEIDELDVREHLRCWRVGGASTT